MFFSRKAAKPAAARQPASAPSQPSPAAGDVSIVLDALGGVLQAYARHALDTETLDAEASRTKITEWMRHATMGARHPTRAGDSPGGLAERDWRGLVHFTGEHRRSEQQHAHKGTRDLRETIWAIVSSTHRMTQADVECGRAVSEQLERVKAAVEGSDAAAVRREALAAVQAVGTLMIQQRDAQRRECAALAERLRALGSQLEDARRETAIDPLTRLANRKGWDEFIERSVAVHALSGEPASLLMIDLDRFKAANDTFGHTVGDAALRAVGDCLARVFMRRCDLVCRYGGDEFAVLLAETDAAKAGSLAERVLSAVHDAPFPERGALSLDLSIGVAGLAPGDSVATWMQRADVALYAAKQRGGGRVVIAGGPAQALTPRATASSTLSPKRSTSSSVV